MRNIQLGAIDPGFGRMKTARIIQQNNGNPADMVTYSLPSVVGVGSTNRGNLGLTGIVRRKSHPKPFKVSFEGMDYLVGDGVGRYASESERMDFDRFTDSPELRALLYASLVPLFNEPDVSLVVGLPVEILKDKTLAQTTEREMKRWLVGTHTFRLEQVGGSEEAIEKRITVHNIKTKEQPLGTWLDWGMDNTGQWFRGIESARAPALIFDPGFNTFDIYAIEGGEIDRRTDGDMLGLRRVAEFVIDQLEGLYDLEMSLHEADELVQKVNAGKKTFTPVEGQEVDVTTVVRQALYSWAADVRRYVSRKVGKTGKFRLFLTGGGSYVLASRLASDFQNLWVPEDPITANARGLAKLAQRDGYL